MGGAEGTTVRDVYTRDGPGVVTVDVSTEKGPAGGSGFVVADGGYVVTNQHVVADANSTSVRLASGAMGKAEVVGQDPSTDIAVLKVDAPDESLSPLALGDSNAVEVGDPVIAIGNPLNVGVSVTTGIVSALDRPIKAPNDYTINGAVQTDAPISSGNSGGPLLDSSGAVIGVTSQAAGSGPFDVAQGIGFAVPINTVKSVAQQLIKSGNVEHAYIGVSMFQVGIEELAGYSGQSTEDLSDGYGLPENGAIVRKVTGGSPADEAGIKGGEQNEREIGGIPVPLGDVITKVEGDTVHTSDDITKRVNSLKPGDSMTLTVVTPGEEPREAKVTLGVQPDEKQK